MERRRRRSLICHECGDPFMAKKSNALYCSTACKQRAHRRKYREMRRMERKGPTEINPYFLVRGDIYKNISSGYTLLNGVA